MIEIIWEYKIKHDKKEPLNRYERMKIKNSLMIGFKNGIVKNGKNEINWKVKKN